MPHGTAPQIYNFSVGRAPSSEGLKVTFAKQQHGRFVLVSELSVADNFNIIKDF